MAVGAARVERVREENEGAEVASRKPCVAVASRRLSGRGWS